MPSSDLSAGAPISTNAGARVVSTGMRSGHGAQVGFPGGLTKDDEGRPDGAQLALPSRAIGRVGFDARSGLAIAAGEKQR
jgi:hypothetical protein